MEVNKNILDDQTIVDVKDSESDVDLNSSITNTTEKEDNHMEVAEHVIKYISIDNMIKTREKEITELKSQKKPKEELILEYLTKKKADQIEISDGILLKNKAETRTALSVDIIRTALKEKIADAKVVEELITRMDELRPKSTKVNLKRTLNIKTKKNKNIGK